MLVSKSHSLLFLLQLSKSTCPKHSSVHSRPHYRLCVCHTHGCMFVGSELNGEEQAWREQATTTIARVSVLCSEMESSVYFTLGWMGLRSSPSPFLLLLSNLPSPFFLFHFSFLFPLSRVIVWHWHKLCAFLSNFQSCLGFLPSYLLLCLESHCLALVECSCSI